MEKEKAITERSEAFDRWGWRKGKPARVYGRQGVGGCRVLGLGRARSQWRPAHVPSPTHILLPATVQRDASIGKGVYAAWHMNTFSFDYLPAAVNKIPPAHLPLPPNIPHPPTPPQPQAEWSPSVWA